MANFDRGNRGGGRSYGRSGGSRFGGGGRDSGSRGFGRGPASYGGREDREMHHAVCDNCGKNCEVPFKPTGSKPVLCSDCFGKSREGSDSGRFNDRGPRRSEGGGQPQNNRQLETINAKLDQVLALLNGAPKGKPARPVDSTPKAEKTPKVVKALKKESTKLDVSEILDMPVVEEKVSVEAPVEETPSSEESNS